MRIYWIDFLKKGALGMMARPKGNDWLEDEIISLKNNEIDLVVSLLEKQEEISLKIENESFFCKKYDINYINFPIPDRGIPKNTSSFVSLIETINEYLKCNKKVVVHCRMGIGRTSLVAAALLIKNNSKYDNVFNYLSATRTLTVPDTEEQKDWIKNQQDLFKNKEN